MQDTVAKSGRDGQGALAISQWFDSALGSVLLASEHELLKDLLKPFFGSYCLHYGFQKAIDLPIPNISHTVRLGPALDGVELRCDEQAWPVCEHAADLVILQHGLDFSQSPHAVLREAAQAVRPGGHLLIVGINPFSAWGMRSALSHHVLGDARCISAPRLTDWLSLLGFALEKQVFGCYRPPLSNAAWQTRLLWCERFGQRWRLPCGGFYVLVARKLMSGLRPLKPSRREVVPRLLPLPVAKVTNQKAPE